MLSIFPSVYFIIYSALRSAHFEHFFAFSLFPFHFLSFFWKRYLTRVLLDSLHLVLESWRALFHSFRAKYVACLFADSARIESIRLWEENGKIIRGNWNRFSSSQQAHAEEEVKNGNKHLLLCGSREIWVKNSWKKFVRTLEKYHSPRLLKSFCICPRSKRCTARISSGANPPFSLSLSLT
jgi:hypothetical protein